MIKIKFEYIFPLLMWQSLLGGELMTGGKEQIMQARRFITGEKTLMLPSVALVVSRRAQLK